MAEVQLQKVTKRFGAATALADVTMVVPDGAFVVLLGRYFAGESLRKSAREHLEHLGAHPDPESKPASQSDPARPSRAP